MNNPTLTHDGWTTYYRIVTVNNRVLLVQKNDGETRTVVVPVRPRMGTTGHSYPGAGRRTVQA